MSLHTSKLYTTREEVRRANLLTLPLQSKNSAKPGPAPIGWSGVGVNLQVNQHNGTVEQVHKPTKNFSDDFMITHVTKVSTPQYNTAQANIVSSRSTPNTTGNPAHHPMGRPNSAEVIIWSYECSSTQPEVEQLHMQHSAVIVYLT